MARVAIVIVAYQSGDVVGGCLDSLLTPSLALTDVEIVVVDNASLDHGPAEVEQRGVRLIRNSHNAGFAGAVNQGVRATSAPLILLLNPDIRLLTGIEPLIDCFRHDPSTGGAGGLLVGEDGKPQVGFTARSLPTSTTVVFEILGINRLWPSNSVNWHYRCLGKDPMVEGFAEQPPGALFMFRRAAWETLGGFDQRFWPVWFEDVDFCARLRAAGYTIRYNPATRAIHQGGHSVSAVPLESREKYWYGSLLKYAAKHFSRFGFWAVGLSVMAGAAGRALVSFPRGGLRVFPVYSAVIRLAFTRLWGSDSGARGRV